MKITLLFFYFTLLMLPCSLNAENLAIEGSTVTAIPAKHVEAIPLGTYRHYKGDLYTVIGIGYHTETMEQVVIYQARYYSKEYGNNALWVRPLSMFLEKVVIEGKEISRFSFVE
jgi:hypothetical protein